MMTSWPCASGGKNGIGGATITLAIVESSSGAVSAAATNELMTSGVAGSIIMPPTIVSTSCSRYWKRVATPKFPPPPRIAQKRSGCVSASTRRSSPLAVDLEPLHLREIEHDSPIGDAVTGDAVAAATDGELQPALARERNHARDVGRVLNPDDERWAAVEPAVEDGAYHVVAVVVGAYELAPHLGRKLPDGRLVEEVGLVYSQGILPIVSHDLSSDRWSSSDKNLTGQPG